MNRHSESLKYALHIIRQERFKKYVQAIYLYGSCARQEQKYSSDVDLLIQIDNDTPKQVLLDMRNEVIPEDYTLPSVELKFSKGEEFSSSRQFNHNIEQEGVLLWERT